MKFAMTVATAGVITTAAMGLAGSATAAPGFGSVQDTISALQAKGFNVQINGAVVYPLSWCKVTGIEGMNNSNIDSAGNKIDPTEFDTVYVDVFCKGG
jgi:hypothetical protein